MGSMSMEELHNYEVYDILCEAEGMLKHEDCLDDADRRMNDLPTLTIDNPVESNSRKVTMDDHEKDKNLFVTPQTSPDSLQTLEDSSTIPSSFKDRGATPFMSHFAQPAEVQTNDAFGSKTQPTEPIFDLCEPSSALGDFGAFGFAHKQAEIRPPPQGQSILSTQLAEQQARANNAYGVGKQTHASLGKSLGSSQGFGGGHLDILPDPAFSAASTNDGNDFEMFSEVVPDLSNSFSQSFASNLDHNPVVGLNDAPVPMSLPDALLNRSPFIGIGSGFDSTYGASSSHADADTPLCGSLDPAQFSGGFEYMSPSARAPISRRGSSNFLSSAGSSTSLFPAGSAGSMKRQGSATSIPLLASSLSLSGKARGAQSSTGPIAIQRQASSAALAAGVSKTSLRNVSRAASVDKGRQADSKLECSNCHTRTTPLWRRHPDGWPLCNACGLFLKLHGELRPLSLKTDVIKKRNRSSNQRRSKTTREQHEGNSVNVDQIRPGSTVGEVSSGSADGGAADNSSDGITTPGANGQDDCMRRSEQKLVTIAPKPPRLNQLNQKAVLSAPSMQTHFRETLLSGNSNVKTDSSSREVSWDWLNLK